MPARGERRPMMDSGRPTRYQLARAEPAIPPREPTDTTAAARSQQPEKPSMRIDAYTHYFPKKFFDKMMEIAGDYKDMGKRVRALPALYDLDTRKKIVDGHKDYQQIISYPQ